MAAVDLARFFPALATGPTQPASSSAVVDVSAPASSLVLADGANGLLTESPVAKYPTLRPAQISGRLFIASPSLVCYAVKPSYVRVIDVNTTAKTLLKWHSQPVVDMCFGDAGTVITVGQDAMCVVSQVTAQGPDGLEAVQVARMTMPAGHGAQRCKLHPQHRSALFIAHGPWVTSVLMDTFSPRARLMGGIEFELEYCAVVQMQAHTGTVIDFDFSEDGMRAVTAGLDGTAHVWNIAAAFHAAPPSVLMPMHSLTSSPSLAPLTACFFSASLVVLGTQNNTEWAIVDLDGQLKQTLKCDSGQPVAPLCLRADLVREPGRAYLALADMNSAALAVVELEALFSRAVVLAVGNPVYSLAAHVAQRTLELQCADAVMIQTYSLSLAKAFPPKPAQAASAAAAPRAAANAAEQQPILSPRTASPHVANVTPPVTKDTWAPPAPTTAARQPTPELKDWMSTASAFASAAPLPSASAASAANAADIAAVVQQQMDALFARLEESTRARDEAEKARQMRLLEVMSASLIEMNATVERTIAAKLASPEFVGAIAAAVVAKQPAAQGDKGLAKALAPALDKMADSVAQSTAVKVQPLLQRALEEQFARHLVPAFQAGCGNLLQQMREAVAGAGAPQNQQQQAGGAAGASGAQRGSPIGEARYRIALAIERHDVADALQVALTARNAELLSEACTQLNLRHVLQTQPEVVSQVLLISLLQQLALDARREPEKKLDWLEAVALAIDPADAGIAAHLQMIANQARESLVAASSAYAALPKAEGTRFRALIHILVSLGSNA